MYIVSFVIGLIIVISSIFLIRFELNRAVRSQAMLLEQSKVYKDSDLFDMLENLQSSIDEMNRAFYDIASDLEGKYSIHDKEIELINQMIETLKKQIISSHLEPQPHNSTGEIRANINNMNKKNDDKKQVLLDNDFTDQELLEVGKNNNHEQELIDQIIEMRSTGKSLAQIARELGIGMGEIQLLLSLKK